MQTIKSHLTVYRLLKKAANTEPQREAIYDLISRRTFSKVLEDVDCLASALRDSGVKKGDRVAMGLPNWYETILIIFATAKIGAILVPFNPLYKIEEVEYILNDSKPQVLFMTDRLGKHALDKVGEYTSKLIIVRSGLTEYDSFSSFIKNTTTDVEEVKIDVNQDVYCILYTSGTTGNPKGVMITHRSVVQSGITISQELHCDNEDVYIVAAPLFHVFGMACNLFSAIAKCSRIVLMERYSPRHMLEVIEKERVTIQHGVPTMFLKELALEDFDNYDVTSLRAGIVGAAPITPQQMKEIRNKLGMNLCQSYGITETGSVTITPYDDAEKYILTTVGKPISEVKVKIVDENREELPVNEVGEIAIHSFGTMKGYYNMPNETNEVIDNDGWFYTGDLGRIDEDGYLHFSGREKELIIRGGYNVYPQEIEEVLLTNSEVVDAAVIGIPDDILGEQVCAVVQLRNKGLSQEDIIDYVTQYVSKFKVPQKVIFIDEFPMTSSGKVKKNVLKQQIMASI